jgi:hypothetical protein
VVKHFSRLHLLLLLKIGRTTTHNHPLSRLRSIIKEIPMILPPQIPKEEEINTSTGPKDNVKIVFTSKTFQNTITKSKS